MKIKMYSRWGAIAALAIGLSGCAGHQGSTPSMQVFDTLPKGNEMPIHTAAKLNTASLSAQDVESILSALARTPKIDYDINEVKPFPDPGIAMAACVRTKKHYVFLSRCRDDQWHVYNIARYVADPFPIQTNATGDK